MIPTSCLGASHTSVAHPHYAYVSRYEHAKPAGCRLKTTSTQRNGTSHFFIDASSNKHQSTIRKSRTCNTSPQKKIPSGKLTWQWTITIFNGKIHYKWAIGSIFHGYVTNYQRLIPQIMWDFLPNLGVWASKTPMSDLKTNRGRRQTCWGSPSMQPSGPHAGFASCSPHGEWIREIIPFYPLVD